MISFLYYSLHIAVLFDPKQPIHSMGAMIYGIRFIKSFKSNSCSNVIHTHQCVSYAYAYGCLCIKPSILGILWRNLPVFVIFKIQVNLRYSSLEFVIGLVYN
jgi:hypothetical protein